MKVISPEARIYALIELSRRAGVASEFLQGWKIAFSPEGDALVVEPQPGAGAQIRFPLFCREVQIDQVVRKTWYADAQIGRAHV